MLAFRQAAAAGDVSALEKLMREYGDAFNIDEPGPKSGKTAAHVAAEKAHFKAIYWLLERGANFYCKDNTGKTAADYLQQKELTSIGLSPMSHGDRRYYLGNAHFKIWFAHDPALFMPYLYQNDFKQYREKNPDGCMSLVYSESLLNDKALSELQAFAKKYQITLISFENELNKFTEKWGTESDKQCYQWASYELSQYPNQGGGNLAVVADLMRWNSVLLRMGNYSDTDVEIGQHKWTDSIRMEKPVAMNLGSLIYPSQSKLWLNADIIAVASLLPHLTPEGTFRIVLSKAACFIIQQVQFALLSSCQQKMKARMARQQIIVKTSSDLSLYLTDLFKAFSNERGITDKFSSEEISYIKKDGLQSFSEEQRASILERIANLKRKVVEKEYATPEDAHKYSSVFQDVKSNDHEQFLKNYMLATQMTQIKELIKQFSGAPVFILSIGQCILSDDYQRYSIYSNKEVESAFRSTNTVRFNTPIAVHERRIETQKLADLSFTFFGMADVLKRSRALEAEHQKGSGLLCP